MAIKPRTKWDWIRLDRNGVRYTLTDGYRLDKKRFRQLEHERWRKVPPWHHLRFEQIMAEGIYWSCKGMVGMYSSVLPVYVWIIGNSYSRTSWVRHASEMLKTISENDRNYLYRIAIVGHKSDFKTRYGQYRPILSASFRKVGLVGNKVHQNRTAFREAGTAILEHLADFHHKHQSAPTPVLRELLTEDSQVLREDSREVALSYRCD